MSKRADYAAISKAVVEAVERRYMLSGAPAIVHFDYRDGAQIRTDNGFDVSFEFDAPIANVSTSAIEITDVNNPQSVIRPSSISRQATSLSARVGVGPGSYVIRVRSGEGFVEGVDGQDLDGEYNGENAFSGDEVAGGDFVFGVTVLPFATPPTAPHDVRAYPLSSGAIEVHYRLDQESGYGISVERAEGDGAFVVIHSSPFPLGSGYEGVFAYIDSAVEADKTYRYRVSQNFYVGNEPARSTPSEEVVAQVLPSSLDVPIASVAAIGGLHPDWLTPLGTRLFYSLNNPEIRTDWRTTGSTGLWVTDSSGSPPVQLYNAPVRELIAFNGKLFFSGYAAQTGWELYCSDGTVEGTSLFKEIESGSGSFPIRMIAASSDFLFFGVNRSATGYEIWKTNGSAEGTVKATDALAFLDESRNTSASSRRLATISDHGSSLYFRKANADGSDAGQLWRLLGATGETSQIAGAVHPEWLTDLNGSLYFKGRTGVFATEYNPPLHKFGLYKVESDTAALLSTTGPDEQNYSFFYRMERVGNQLFFEATGRTSPNETIWVSDGTAAGTKPLRNPLGGNQLHLHGIQDVNGVAYMIAVYAGGNFNSAGVVLKSDGTDRGTKLFRDFRGTTDDETQLFAQSAANHYVYTDGLKVWLTGDTRESGRQIGVFGPTFEAGVRFGNVSASIGDALFFTTRVDPYTRDLRLANLTPPAAPSSLTTSPTGGGVGAGTGAGGIGLSWADNANNERGYTLDRYAPGATLPEATVQLPPNVTSFTDPAGVAGGSYRLRAYNAGGYSPLATTALSSLQADIVDVVPDPRATPVDSVTIAFSGKTYGFAIGDLQLTRNGGKNLLTGANRLSTSDQTTFTLTNLRGITTPAGNYSLRLVASGGPVDGYGRVLGGDVLESWTNNAVAVATTTKFNFQPATAPTVSGYLVDSGAIYGTRNGQTYGWTTNHSSVIVDRNKNSNQLLDTNVAVLAGGKWELAVPNGTYVVKVGIGDSGASSNNNVYVEGQALFAYQSLAANAFASKSMTVNVSDGRLTLGIGSAATGTTKLDYVEVTSPPTSPPPTSPPPTSPPPTSPPPPASGGTKVNFQPATAPVVAGYLVDSGATYASRNGQTYGWSTSHSDVVVDRNLNGDQLVDTNVGVKAAGKWEMAVANGTYVVKVGVGDSGASSKNNVYVEGQALFNYVQLAANAFASKSITVNVTDGRLTLGIGSAAGGTTKIDYVEVTSPTSPPPTSPPPTSPPPISPPPPTSGGTKVNFQPSSATTVAGYLVDAGSTYGARNGKTYGWSVDHADVVFDRNINADQRLDTALAVKQGGKWELAVANGTYVVNVSVGDAGATSKNNVWIEGQQLFNQQSQAANVFSTRSITVTVSDGRLTLGIGSVAGGLTKLNYLEVN